MLLISAVTGVKASDHNPWQDYDIHCPFWAEHFGLDPILFNYDEKSNRYYIEWMIALKDDNGDDELFREDKGHGLATYIKVGNQDEVYLGNFHAEHESNAIKNPQLAYYENNIKIGSWMVSNVDFTHPYFPLGGKWQIVKEWSDKSSIAQQIGEYKLGITVRWYIPDNLLNTTITIREEGDWYKCNSNDHYHVNVSKSVTTSYAFSLPSMSWNTNYSVAADGTITVPYSFGQTSDTRQKATRSVSASTSIYDLSYLTSAGGSAPTEGLSHIATRIDGVWSEGVGNKDIAKYVSGYYTFNLSDIDMNMRSSFSLQPYIEFTHENDKDANNGTKQYQNFATTKTFLPLPVATGLIGTFDQAAKKVRLQWTGTDVNNYSGGKWVVYCGDEYVGTVNKTDATQYSFEYSDFPYESNLDYTVYYVMGSWNDETKRSELASNTVTVSTQRKVPINNLSVVSEETKIIFTWTTDAYLRSQYHKFKIYIDDEATPIEIEPTADNQTVFRWEHRSSEVSQRQNNQESTGDETVYWTTEKLDGCTPHDYRIEGVVDDSPMLNKAEISQKAVGLGTQFYSLDATKGSYAGIVKLSWHVDRRSDDSKNYIIDRRRAEKEEPWTTIHRMSSAEEYLMYSDDTPLPGVFYEYRITVQDKCDNGTVISTQSTDIGFAQTSGTISGRITYGATGSSVAGVDVVARKTGEASDDVDQYHAIRFTSDNGSVSWEYPSTSYATSTFSQKSFTVQMWIRPESLGEAKILRLKGEDCYIGMNASGIVTFHSGEFDGIFTGAQLSAGQYNHVTVTSERSNSNAHTLVCYIVGADESGAPVVNRYPCDAQLTGDLSVADVSRLSLGHFTGYVDEFRLWNKVLTENDIQNNYDHLLVGNEAGLETYWTFDEGLHAQFFDYSRDGSNYNQHHGRTGSNAQPSNITPEDLKLKAKTDADGNYVIKGVPFSGSGSTYAVIPTMGIHSFNPSQQLRFINNSSLVHNGTDFTDISSFPVRGTIYYAGTNYPVEGVEFSVDGIACTKNSKRVTTNAYGEYEISVPIGEHYITVELLGHEFANGGRYPADPDDVDTRVNFNDAVKDLAFSDITLVPVVGRVVGGDIEKNKPLGFGESKNNIGQATITLGIEGYSLNMKTTIDEQAVYLEPNEADLPVASASDKVNSTTIRKGGTIDDTKTVIIKTDPKTGEFAALLPPIDYAVRNIVIDHNSAIEFAPETLPTIYAHDPLTTSTDTLVTDDGEELLYEYCAKLVMAHYTSPVLDVTQNGFDQTKTGVGFGETKTNVKDPITKERISLNLIQKKEGQDAYEYTYDYPIFEQMNPYIFDVTGYELYVNQDGAQPVEDRVPLKDVVVRFTNEMGTGSQVVLEAEDGTGYEEGDVYEAEENTVTLDENGFGQYQWQAGFPNITAPYTRNIAAEFTAGGRSYTWTGHNADNALTGIVIGNLSSGNNFTTEGPDEVDMILRDPGGSGSQATWETSVSVTKTSQHDITANSDLGVETTTDIGSESWTLAGTVSPGVVAGVISPKEEKTTFDLNVTASYGYVKSHTTSTTVTSSQAISTSDDELIGAEGDIFIGKSTNLIFGDARKVGFKKEDGKWSIGMSDCYVVSQKFGTEFKYTQSHIETSVIPELKDLRNALLETVSQTDYDAIEASYDSNPLYLTTLSREDENFGSDGTYKFVMPTEENADARMAYQDMVAYYNQQIENWIGRLRDNEKAKVTAINNPDKYLRRNISFDGGIGGSEETVEYTNAESNSTEHSFTTTVYAGRGWKNKWFGFDMEYVIRTEDSAGGVWVDGTDEEEAASFGFTLDDDAGDALSIDVFEAPDGFGPIFVTRGGKTSCPYEGEQRTKYYEPGEHVLATATMQIEVPKISVENAANRVNNVPTGGKATYRLLLTNESESGDDCYYRLSVADDTNSEGAKLSINGDAFEQGRLVVVPAGSTLPMTLQLEQTDLRKLNYENIGIVLSSPCQEDIADVTYVSAQFVAVSTDVTLRIDNTVVNTATAGKLPLSVRDFDPNFNGLKYIAVQYQGLGETMWHNAQRYIASEDYRVETADLPLNDNIVNGNLSLQFDMTNATLFPDRTYKFRAISACTDGDGEVTKVSDEIQVVKDMYIPKPLGQPQPADGILSAGDEISILFNEDILGGELKKENVRVMGVLNGSEVEHQTAFKMPNGITTPAAKTEANIPLDGKDFSIDAWVKLTTAGTLLKHGDNGMTMTVGTNAENKLVVTIGKTTYTSDNTVPTGKWAFLTLSMTADGKLSASVADDATTTTLFQNKPAIPYTGNGPLSIGTKGEAGENAEAAIHELLLWDEAHDIATALQQRSVTKSPRTRHLIGYWKMDEGEGTAMRDYSRNRHLTASAETWNIENTNKGVNLDGSHYLSIPTAEIPPLSDDDYCVEFWVKAGEQASDACLAQMGATSLLVANGQLLFNTGSENVQVNASVLDEAWHHVAVNVLRSGNTVVYVDGVAAAAISSKQVADMASDALFIGAQRIINGNGDDSTPYYSYNAYLTGNIDDVRIWKATKNGTEIAKNRKLRLCGDESGLVAYYPFELNTVDPTTHQPLTQGLATSLANEQHEATMYAAATASDMAYTDQAPTLRVKSTKQNVSFDFVASSNKIVISLTEDADKIEGCMLDINVNNVHDLNGNLFLAATWTAFVDQNPLAWKESEMALTQNVTEEGTITATLMNNGGKYESWTLGGLPAWLTADVEYGSLTPLAEQKVVFTVNPSTAIGNYAVTVYAKGNDGIETPLTLNVKVTGQMPEWAVDPHALEGSMNIIGMVSKTDGTYLSNSDDILAAFIGEECRGVAHPVYNQRYGSYYFTMDIYGSGSDIEKEVEFRAYDASTGIVYPKVTLRGGSSITYMPALLDGTYNAPKLFDVTNLIEQTTVLKAGWNWLSLYVNAEDMSVPAILHNVADDVVAVKDHGDGFLLCDDGAWSGEMDDLTNTQMYAVKMKTERKLRIVGQPVTGVDVTVMNGWNWIGYYGSKVASVKEALSDYDANDEDILKGKSGVAYWDVFEWSGSLLTMQPGLGYQLKSNASDTKQFTYPGNVSANSSRSSSSPRSLASEHRFFSPVSFRKYPDNAIMTAKVTDAGQPLAGVEMAVFAGDECRTTATTNEQGIVYLTIPGDETCQLTFKVAVGEQIVDATQTIDYETDAIYGTAKHPVVIDLQTNGIHGIPNAEFLIPNAVYDLQGRKVDLKFGNRNAELKKGVYVVNGKKKVVK